VAAVAGTADATDALEEVLEAGLLDQLPGATTDDLTFPHPLVRAAIYGDLSPTRRRALHTAAGGLIPGTPGLSHRVAAAEGVDENLALDLEETARTEVLGGAMSAAADHLLWASELSGEAMTREARLFSAVFAVVLSGDKARAATMTPAVQACADGPDRNRTLGWLAYIAGDITEAEAQFRLSVASAAESSPQAGMAAGALAILTAVSGEGRRAIAWGRRALDAPPAHPAVHPYARIGLAFGLAMTGSIAEALSALGPIEPEHATPAPFEAELLATRGQIRVWTNELSEAVEDLSRVVRWARSGATVRRLADVYTNLADAQYRIGAWDDAQIHAELGVSLAEDMEAVWELSSAHAVASYVYSGRGAWDQASAHFAAARRTAEQFSTPAAWFYTSLAQSLLARSKGDHETVIASLAPVLEGQSHALFEEMGSVPPHVLMAEALIGTGRLKEAEHQVLRLEDIADLRETPAIQVEACRLRGSLEDARGEPKAAALAFTGGLAVLEGVTLPFEQALLEAAYGRFLRRTDQRRAAIAALRAARDRLASMDARPYLVFCDAELAGCGLRPPPGAPANPFGFTAKERAVAHLAAEGMSNREIAGELYVSAKAVEYHLSHVFTKLGITSRRQLRPTMAASSG
jgi:DNA-binding CsgD family transcriptional regulator/tetratricopeptide (TPR) repeat protein